MVSKTTATQATRQNIPANKPLPCTGRAAGSCREQPSRTQQSPNCLAGFGASRQSPNALAARSSLETETLPRGIKPRLARWAPGRETQTSSSGGRRKKKLGHWKWWGRSSHQHLLLKSGPEQCVFNLFSWGRSRRLLPGGALGAGTATIHSQHYCWFGCSSGWVNPSFQSFQCLQMSCARSEMALTP